MGFITNLKINRSLKKIKAMQQNRIHNPTNTETLHKEITACKNLAHLFQR